VKSALTLPEPITTGRGIRAFTAADLADVAALRRRAFQTSEHENTTALVDYCRRIFLENPWHDDELKSLVCVDDDGRVIGFIGVIPRPMRFEGEVIRAAVVTQMMVAPEARGLAGRELVRAMLSGPQDLTLTDTANEPARRVWKSVGATEAVTMGFTWERVLRPLQRWHSKLKPVGLPLRAAAFASQPLLIGADAVTARPPSGRTDGMTQALDVTLMASAAESMLADLALRPHVDAPALAWLINEASLKRGLGRFSGGIVHEARGGLAGWFMHYVQPRGVSSVVQIVAHPGARRLVMDHLLQDAWQLGAIAVTGRLDASLLPVVEDSRFTLRRQAPWVLFHSRRPELQRAIEGGRATLSRLEGEYWLRF
jgi:hypothetical protein